MSYEDLIFGIAGAIIPSLTIILTIGFTFDCINGLLFSKGRW